MYYHYYEYPDAHRVLPHLGIRTDRYKLILFYGKEYVWELYDLMKDPNEMQNIIDKPANKKLIRNLKNDLKSMMVQYKDKAGLAILSNGS